jgi:hypothetical protein
MFTLCFREWSAVEERRYTQTVIYPLRGNIMSVVVDPKLTKICHAVPGTIIRLPEPETGEIRPELFMLLALALDKPSRRKKPPFGSSAGLYNEERELLLVSLSTGLARKLPHLSTRVDFTHLKLEDVVPGAVQAPVLVSTLEETLARVTLGNTMGRRTRDVNLAIPAEVLALLKFIKESAAEVTEVKTMREVLEDEAKARWRKAVASGQTLLSFEDFVSTPPA